MNPTTLTTATAAEPSWRADVRADATRWLADHKPPTKRDELWRYSDVDTLLEAIAAEPADESVTVDAATIARLAGDGAAERLVLVNARAVADPSPPAGSHRIVDVLSRRPSDDPCPTESYRSLQDEDWLLATNRAAAADVAVVEVLAGSPLDPVQVVHVTAPSARQRVASHPTTLIRVEAGAAATVVESHVGLDGAAIANSSTTIEVGTGASLTYHRVEQGVAGSAHAGHVSVQLGTDACLRATSFIIGASTTRVVWDIVAAGDGSSVELDGLVVAGSGEHHDHVVTVDHLGSNTNSEQRFREIVGARASAAFTGRVLVRPGTVGTSAHQRNASLLLAPTAEANARPWLEIDADDVRCTHGATVGQLDDEAIFYLRSRGIPEVHARQLLIEGFAGQVLEAVELAWLREHLRQSLEEQPAADRAPR